MKPELDSRERVRLRGRRAGIVVFGVVVAGVTALWSGQILFQVFGSGSGQPSVDCRSGLRALLAGVSAARQASAAASDGEEESLTAFRAALAEPWKARPALDAACSADLRAREMLAEIDELRYAEEHAVRYEAMRLAGHRKRARAIAAELGGVPEGSR